MAERKVYNAAIFRRGAKKELFGDREEDDSWDEASELKEKLQGLHDLWAEPRVGWVLLTAAHRRKHLCC